MSCYVHVYVTINAKTKENEKQTTKQNLKTTFQMCKRYGGNACHAHHAVSRRNPCLLHIHMPCYAKCFIYCLMVKRTEQVVEVHMVAFLFLSSHPCPNLSNPVLSVLSCLFLRLKFYSRSRKVMLSPACHSQQRRRYSFSFQHEQRVCYHTMPHGKAQGVLQPGRGMLCPVANAMSQR